MPPRKMITTRSAIVAAVILLEACGGGGSTTTPPPPPPPPPLVLAAGTPSGNNQTGVVGQALSAPLRVRGTRDGAAAAGEAVTWSASAGQIIGAGPTGADGNATATWTLGNTPGAQTATATSGNQTVQFAATATATPQGNFAIAFGTPSGNNQTAAAGGTLADVLRVVVTNNAVPASGILVVWQAAGANGSFNPPQSFTNAQGIAVSDWTLGSALGAQSSSATAAGQSLQFVATATAPVLAIGLGSPSGNNQTAVAGSTLPDLLRVVVTSSGAPAPGVIVIWETTAPFGSFNPPQTLTNSQGIATSEWTLGTTVGAQAATAFAGSSTGPTVAFAATGTQGQAGATVDITLSIVGGGRFSPANVVIAAGTTVRWTWLDDPHTVTSTGTPTFPGHPVAAGPPTVYEFTFTTPGTYRFYCSEHGTPTTGMRGTVVVQ